MNRTVLTLVAFAVGSLGLGAISMDTWKTHVGPGPVQTWVEANPTATEMSFADVYATEHPAGFTGTITSVAVACPYDTPEVIAQSVGRAWDDAHTVAMSDDVQAVLAVTAERTWVEVLPRSVLDLCGPGAAGQSNDAPGSEGQSSDGQSSDGEVPRTYALDQPVSLAGVRPA